MDLKDISKEVTEKVEKFDKKDIEKVVDTVKEGAKKVGINDVSDIKEKIVDATSKLKK